MPRRRNIVSLHQEKRLLNVEEAAYILGIDRKTVYFHIYKGHLSKIKRGGKVFLDRTEVEAFRRQREER